MIEFDGEKYVTASEVVQRFKISRGTCYSNVIPALTACYLPGKKRPVYKLSEVEKLSQVRTVERKVHSLTLMQGDVVESVS